MAAPVLVNVSSDITILESQAGGDELPEGSLRFVGVALRDNIISQRGRGRYYSREFNDRCAARTQARIDEGKTPVTVYTRHGKAIPPKGHLPASLPVGKVEKVWREDDRIMYQALIVPTSEGRDAALLVRTGVQRPTSVRIGQFIGKARKINGSTVEEAIDGVLYGVDLADEAGIEGAGIVNILEDTPEWDDEGETDMDWANITLADLKEHCPALLEEHVSEYVGRIEALQTEVQSLTTQIETLQANTEVEALQTQLAETQFTLALAQASLTGVSAKVFEALSTKVTQTEDIPTVLPQVRMEALNAFLSAPRANEGVPTGHTFANKERQTASEGTEAAQVPEAQTEGLELL